LNLQISNKEMHRNVLFINPGGQKKVYQSLANEFSAIDIPIWACLISGYLKNRDFNPSIYDTNVDGWDEKSPELLSKKYNPDLIVVLVFGHHPSASTQTMPSARTIAGDLKKFNKDLQVAFGGTHPSAIPERTLSEENIDYVIRGEGCLTIEGLLLYFSGKLKINEIPGLWHKKNGSIENNKSAEAAKDLDSEFSRYSLELLPDINNYRAHNWHCFQDFEKSKTPDFSDVRSPYVSLYSSLGCPYSCSYCCINALFGKPGIRFWSIEKIISFIDEIANKYKVKNIRLADELFVLNAKRVEDFCDRIIERKYDLNIWVYGRIDTIDVGILSKMKKAGINWICLGIESGNQLIRKNVNKKINGNIFDIVKAIKDNGIYAFGNYMFGLPDDTLDTMKETMETALQLNCEFANFYTVMAYPGSKLYEDALKQKEILPESWAGYSHHGYLTKPLPTKTLTAKDVLRFRDESFIKYFTEPSYLNHVTEIFGIKTLNHIKKMTGIKLKRKLFDE